MLRLNRALSVLHLDKKPEEYYSDMDSLSTNIFVFLEHNEGGRELVRKGHQGEKEGGEGGRRKKNCELFAVNLFKYVKLKQKE